MLNFKLYFTEMCSRVSLTIIPPIGKDDGFSRRRGRKNVIESVTAAWMRVRFFVYESILHVGCSVCYTALRQQITRYVYIDAQLMWIWFIPKLIRCIWYIPFVHINTPKLNCLHLKDPVYQRCYGAKVLRKWKCSRLITLNWLNAIPETFASKLWFNILHILMPRSKSHSKQKLSVNQQGNPYRFLATMALITVVKIILNVNFPWNKSQGISSVQFIEVMQCWRIWQA